MSICNIMGNRNIIGYTITAVAAAALISSCGKMTEGTGNAAIEETVQITCTPEIDVTVTEGGIPATKASDTPVIGTTDIWCFVWDNSKSAPAYGYPAKQDAIQGTTYTFSIPKLKDARVFFAIMPENGVEWTFNNSSIWFSKEDIFERPNEVWASEGTNINSDSDEKISLPEIKLTQRHKNMELRIRCEGFPGKPSEYITGLSFSIYDDDNDITYQYPETVDFSTLGQEADEDGNIWYTYPASVLKDSSASFWLYLSFVTADNCIYSFKSNIYNGNYEDFRLEYTIDYKDISPYLN